MLRTRKNIFFTIVALLAGMGLAACAENPPIEVTPIAVTSDAAPLNPVTSEAGDLAPTVTPVIDADNPLELDIGVEMLELLFTRDTMTAPANTEVIVNFSNNSQALPHNWVLVDGGMEAAAEINQEAQESADFAPSEDNPNIIAQTRMLDPEANQSLTFTTPAPGEYLYICTYPGHFQGGMVGTLVVTEQE